MQLDFSQQSSSSHFCPSRSWRETRLGDMAGRAGSSDSEGSDQAGRQGSLTLRSKNHTPPTKLSELFQFQQLKCKLSWSHRLLGSLCYCSQFQSPKIRGLATWNNWNTDWLQSDVCSALPAGTKKPRSTTEATANCRLETQPKAWLWLLSYQVVRASSCAMLHSDRTWQWELPHTYYII
jgi:hypothetical protein